MIHIKDDRTNAHILTSETLPMPQSIDDTIIVAIYTGSYGVQYIYEINTLIPDRNIVGVTLKHTEMIGDVK